MKTTKFKLSEIGPIPEEWEVKRLGEVADIQLGKMVDEEKNVGTLKYYLSNRDVHWGHIDVSGLHQVRMSDDDLHKYDLCDGDLLVCEGGEVGRAAIWHAPITDCYFQKTLHRVRVKTHSSLCVPYLQGLLRRYAEIGFFDAYVAKTSIAHLPKDKFEILPILLPPRAEQEKIAAALSDVDELLAAMTTLIEKKRAIKQGAMQELLEVRPTALTQRTQSAQRDAKNFEPCRNVERVEEKTYAPRRRLADFTGAWVEKRLGDCGKFSKGAGISRAQANTGKIPAVRYGELYTTHTDCIKKFESFISEEVAQLSVRLNRGDIVFACSGETKEEIGKCAAFLGDEIAYAGGDLIIFSPDNGYDSLFLGFELNTPYCAFQKASAGQGDAIVHIRRESLEELVVRLPPTLAEQKAIAGVLSDMDAEIAALEAKRAKYEQIKQGMMQELLTGKTRLEA